VGIIIQVDLTSMEVVASVQSPPMPCFDFVQDSTLYSGSLLCATSNDVTTGLNPSLFIFDFPSNKYALVRCCLALRICRHGVPTLYCARHFAAVQLPVLRDQQHGLRL
jgi:hypothetical protein